MAWKRYTLLALLLVASSVNASDLRQVADCEKPIYSLDQYASDQDLMLELAIKAYEECLLFVAYDHEQSEKGSHSEIAKANRAIERIPLDWQTVWPLTDVIETAQSKGLWTENRAASAVSTQDEWGTHVYVVLVQKDDDPMVVNITRIEQALFAKLGTADRSEYERFTTEPIEWMDESDGRYMLNVRLRAWREGQRYTVSGPVIVNADGTVIWQ